VANVSKWAQFAVLLVINLALSMIGKMVFFGPVFGFPLIFLYTALIVIFGGKSFWVNFLVSLLVSLGFAGFFSITGGGLILVGMYVQKFGILAFLAFSSHYVAKWQREKR
jgi:hypothetical protein